MRWIAILNLIVVISVCTSCGGGGTSSAAKQSAKVMYRVTASASIGGSITPADVTVESGASTTFTLKPDAGFEISQVTGAAGTLNGNIFTTGAITGDTAVRAVFSEIKISIQGAVYERLDNVAYTPNFSPTFGIPGAAVSLREASASTSQKGTFNISVTPAQKSDRDDLTIQASGYAAGSWPWQDSLSSESNYYGLYPSITVRPRPGFIGGIVPHDVGGFYMDVYGRGLFPSTMERGRLKAGANLVALVDTIEVTEMDVPAAKVSMVGSPPWPNAYNPSISASEIYGKLAIEARSRNIQLMLLIQVYPQVGLIESYFNSIQLINKNSRLFLEAYFAKLKPLALERAIIARDNNIEYLVLGLNHYYINEFAPIDVWEDLIHAIRNIGYRGKIGVMDGSFDGRAFYYGQADMTRFTGLFDFLGLNLYDVVKPRSIGETLPREQTRVRMREDIRSVLDRHQVMARPLFVLLGTPSVFGGVANSEYIEPCLECGSLAPQRTLDLAQQADAYQAMFEVINAASSDPSPVVGLLTWGYHYRDDPQTLLRRNDSAYDKSASVRGKPAEAVMKHWIGLFNP